ncbi:MAG TPA: ATP-binding protein [Candidatus Xenobia bacterium]
MPRKIGGILTDFLLEMLSDPVIAIDKDGKVHVYNEAAAQVFGVPIGRVIGSRVWDCLPMSEFSKALIAMIKESKPVARESTYTFADGRIFSGSVAPVRNDDGRLTGAAGMLRDLTALHRIEEHVSDLVGTVSNQLRPPLTSIKGFVETLLEGAMADPNVTRKFLQVINHESNRMVRLIMSLNEATAPPVAPPPPHAVLVGPSLDRVVLMMRPLAEQKRVRLLSEVPGKVPSVMADEAKLEQVLTNLMDNAIKFSAIRQGGGGTVKVVARVEGSAVEVRVEDNGIGIPAAHIERIFERYYRVQEGPAAQLGGTGLGLSISREILRHFGSDLRAESTPGEQTTFTFTLATA